LDLWNLIIPEMFPEEKIPKTEYINVSRKALAGSALHINGLDESFFYFAFSPAGNKTFGDLLRVYGVPYIKPLENITLKYNISEKTILNDIFNPGIEKNKKLFEKRLNFKRLVNDKNFKDYIQIKTKGQNINFLKYLKKHDFFDDKNVGFADIGWSGSIQSFFNISLKNISKKPLIHSLLLAKINSGLFKSNEYSFSKGIIHDFNNDDSGVEIYISPVFFEELCKSEHSTLLSYSPSGEPVFYNEKEFPENNSDDSYKKLKEGIFFGIKEFININRIYNFRYSELKDYFSLLYFKYLLFPDISLLKKLKIKMDNHLDIINKSNKERFSFLNFFNPWKSKSHNFFILLIKKHLFPIVYFLHRNLIGVEKVIHYRVKKPTIAEIAEINLIKIISKFRVYPGGNLSLPSHLLKFPFSRKKNKTFGNPLYDRF
jgi:hypothetical protein